jgi:eukaryotic-like serine/threonine-protein kinase
VATPLAGIIGGRYALCGELASGGMATVHLARQIGAAGFARIVAVKRLHERFARDPEFVAMFLDEARLVARIRHPNVVQTIDVVAEGSELFLVMEYVHGESLLKLLQVSAKAGTLVPIPIASAILAATLHGLHEAHEARSETGEPLGIVHRDISPHNILVGVDGVARVLDFGVAKATERITTTQEGQLKGKLSYMAPEQVQNRPIDRRTDIYAAAVVLWETLTGSKLFSGSNEAAILNQVVTSNVRPPSHLNRTIPIMLDAVAMRGLARDPGGRFPNAREMALAIERSGPLATASDIGTWVQSTCRQTLDQRAQLIAMIEARSSSTNLQQAVDSINVMRRYSSGPRPVAESTPTSSGPATPTNPSAAPLAVPLASNPPPPVYIAAPPANYSAPPPAQGATFPPPAGSGTGSGRRDAPKDGSNAAMHMTVPPAAGSAKLLFAVVGFFVLVLIGAGLGGVFVYLKRTRAAATASSASARAIASDGGSIAAASAPPAAPAAPVCPAGMALVAPGKFFMGSDDDLPNEKPAHNVTLGGYCMDRYEVSTEAYKACSDRGDCKRAGQTNKFDGMTARDSKIYDPLCNVQADERGKHPINCVDWFMAERFCKAAGKRLPTEAEWEYAARGSDGRKYPWGDTTPSGKHLNACGTECVAWFKKLGAQNDGALYQEDDGWPTTAPVGSFPAGASKFGIEDMVGNVWEWVADGYGAYTAEDRTDPKGVEDAKERVIRGGAWNGAYADWVRPSFRFKNPPDTRSHGIGFRCAKSL